MRAFEFHPEAEQELLAAVRWYDQVRPELGDRFESEVERAIRRILKHPHLFRSLSRRTRRCLLRTFPNGIIFVPLTERIVSIAVMHLNREPG
jgi:plasmid stabilization system protein ParE